MDDEKIVITSSAAISPEAVAGKGFTTSMRGYQPTEVRQFLNRVADELAASVAREAELRRVLHDTQTRAAHPELDESVLTASLGEHAGRLIASARETAAAITAEAERTAAATLRDAEYRIARIRQEADTLMARRVDEADGVSASLRQSAEADARAVRDQAQAEAEAAIQAARSHGKEMVAEARAVRERMLGDLSRRRRVAEVQLEQLRVARGRLVEAYEVVRRTLEEVTAELAAAEPEARLAAEAVGRRMAEADPPLRIADAPLRPTLTGTPTGPSRRPEGVDRSPDLRGRPIPPVSVPSQSGQFQPTHPAPSPTPAPDASVPPPSEASLPEASASEPAAPERSPVPPGWIERAGGVRPASRSSTSPSPMPPSVAAPVSDEADDPWDPGTWAGAGFGPPRQSGPPTPPPESAPTAPPAGPPGPGSGSQALSGSGSSTAAPPLPPTYARPAPADLMEEPLPPPAPTRPPLRPQTVADSLSSRTRSVLASAPQPVADPAPTASPSGGAPAAGPSDGLSAVATEAAPASTASAPAVASSPATSLTPNVDGLRPMPPDLPREVPPTPHEQPPELATAEVPSVRPPVDGPAPVEELFARLRDQVPGPGASPATPAPDIRVADADAVGEEGERQRRDHQLDPLDADLVRGLKRILQDEQNDVLLCLRQGGPGGASAVVAVLDHQASAFAATAAPALSGAHRAGGAPADEATALALGGRLADDLSTPLRERLDRVFAAAGDDPDEVAEAVRAAYRHAKLQEVEQLVRHHTAAAYALGAFTATASGRRLRWVVEGDAPCPDCHDNTLAGPTPKGEPFPTGQHHPPAHRGCRCLLVPVP